MELPGVSTPSTFRHRVVRDPERRAVVSAAQPTPEPTPEEPVGRSAQLATHGGLTAAFLQAAGLQLGEGALVPALLARAVVQVLPVDAGGVSTTSTALRVPLGATTLSAELAEELQTTLGSGPCLEAARAHEGCVFDLLELRRRWPVYAEELTRLTPYRSAASIPLGAPGRQVVAALDLYAEDPRLSERLDVDRVVRELGQPLGALLDVCLSPLRPLEPSWPTEDEDLEPRPEWFECVTDRRFTVWVAVGMVRAREPWSVDDALSVLRGHAYSQGRTLDDVADDIVRRRLRIKDVTGWPCRPGRASTSPGPWTSSARAADTELEPSGSRSAPVSVESTAPSTGATRVTARARAAGVRAPAPTS